MLKDDGSFFINVGKNSKNPWNAMDVVNVLRKHFVLQNEITWVKSIHIPWEFLGKKNQQVILADMTIGHSNGASNSDRYLGNNHEPIFHFTKTRNVHLDKLAIGRPDQDKYNIGRFNDIDLTGIVDVWYIPYPTIQKHRPHPAVFPVELSGRCIKLHI